MCPKIKYCIYTDGFRDLEQLFFKDIIHNENVKIISKGSFINSKILMVLFRLHFSFRISKFFNLPFQSIWYNYIDGYSYEKESADIIYIFHSSWYYPNFFKYLKKKHKNAKIILFFSDTIKSKQKVIHNLNIDEAKKVTDIIYSYNPKDVRDYNLKYLPICYSKNTNIKIDYTDTEYDIVFIGAARNRMTQIENMYYLLKKKHLKVFFYIVDPKGAESSLEDFIVSNKILSMKEYLTYTLKSKCILELVDPDTEGSTLRFWDAVMYNRYLITNNKDIRNSPFYKTGNIFLYNTINDIDFTNFKYKPEYNYNGENSSIKFLETINKDLNIC